MWQIDLIIQNYFFSNQSSLFIEILYPISSLFDLSWFSIAMTLCLVLFIYLSRNFSYAMLFLFSICFGTAVSYFLKFIFDINRPIGSLFEAMGQSFPSTHATVSTIFFVILFYIFGRNISKFPKIVLALFSAIVVILVSLSRLYLGVHWLSDVLFGIGLGAVVSYLSIVIYKKYQNGEFVLK